MTVERLQLDVRKMQQAAKGGDTHFQSWNNGVSAWLRFHLDAAEVETRLPCQPTQCHTIELDRTPLNYGGHRTWWKCPCCDARAGLLYWDGRWACRKCAGLVHASTRQPEDTLAYARVNKVRQKLGWGGGLLSPMGDRPRGMHWATYHRLMWELVAASERAAHESAEVTDRFCKRVVRLTDGVTARAAQAEAAVLLSKVNVARRKGKPTQGGKMTDSPDTRPVPSMKQLEAAALGQLAKMLEKDGGKMPSMEAVDIAAKLMAAKAHRELTARQGKEQEPTAPEREGLKVSPSSFNQRVTGDW